MITWRWTQHGCYTAKSAYRIQFTCSFCTFNCKSIWEARVQGKHRHRFFAWWNSSLQGLQKEQRRQGALLMIFTVWNIWNERNRRIFQHAASLPMRVLALIKENVRLREAACGGSLVYQ
ncbi:hypothetical protein HU200_053318 [Digitaria exilis]|uniref:Uncharacterized protein n=1 Tax=Digitaria exilis TaxID=1010633 RepID=A0A835AXJ7_9POAL|nr:hypothetical protein HU200_053318 [Digitaria exilis]